MAAGAIWARTVPVALFAAGFSKKPVGDEVLLPPALRTGAARPQGDPRVMRDIRNQMFGEGLRQIARKSAARRAGGQPEQKQG
jgi:hypothetical protein